MEDLLAQPENRIGFEGPGGWGDPAERRATWESWLDSIIDNYLGDLYWDSRAARMWSFPDERDK